MKPAQVLDGISITPLKINFDLNNDNFANKEYEQFFMFEAKD